ncbi:MAG TPA: metalloregulator ArsR/SmtB family transcription factor, partial [Polyangiaceae bacterium]|nr:metalloregulator ArsR/SmtB family transcription factor [Polyangiaceae bacterium]
TGRGSARPNIFACFYIKCLLFIATVPEQRSLDIAFAALADPTRRAILARLSQGEATVNELAKPFPISQPAVSRHVRVLVEAGLVVQRVDGTKRPCRLSPAALSDLDRYLEMLREGLERNYQRLDRLLAEQRKGKDTST